MAVRPFFSGRIPQGLYEALEEHRQRTNESKTEILIKALSRYIDHPVEPSALSQSDTVEASRITALEKKIEALEQEFRAIRDSFATESNNSTSKQLPHIDDGIEEEKAGQIPLILTEEVIKPDNDNDNSRSIAIDNNADNTDINGWNSDINYDNQPDNNEYLIHKTFVGTMKTVEVPQLPGLESEDAKKIKVKLNNAKNTKAQKTRIGVYTAVLSKDSEISGGNKKVLLWDVYKDEKESATSVISTDNAYDN